MTKTKTIGGNLYSLNRTFRRKSEADTYARNHRKGDKWGHAKMARVVKTSIMGEPYYCVYTSIGKRTVRRGY